METARTSLRHTLYASTRGLLALMLGCALPHFPAQPVMAAPASTPSVPTITASVTGRLTDANGHSLAGVTVVYFDEANKQTFGQTTSDSNGRYSFAGLNGSYSIVPRATDAAFLPPMRNVTVTATRPRSADFIGYRTPYIIGRVTTAPGVGVAGVIVRRVSRNTPAVTTVTDAAGYYGFANVPADRYELTVSKADHAFLTSRRSVTLGTQDKGLTVNFSALQNAYLSGRVTQLDGGGVGRIGVVLKDSAGAVRVALTDDGGYYGFSDVSAGAYTLVARGPAYNLLPPTRSLTTDGKNSVTRLDFTALVAPFISGRITTPAGSGLPNVLVTLRQEASSNTSTTTAIGRTDSQGYYGFSQVASGTYLITPSLNGYTFRPPLQSVTIDTTGANPRVSYPGLDFVGVSSVTGNQVSPVTLSTTQVNASAATVQLRFSGALDAATASDPAHFTVTIAGRMVAVQSASYNAATYTVTLALDESSLAAASPVIVKWSGLLDANRLTVDGGR